MAKSQRPLPWLDAGESFPPVATAWGHTDPAPGLLAAGAALDVPTLVQAYSQGIFPWFSEGQPVLWWSPNPRMVLNTARFKLHRSLRKSLRHLLDAQRLEIRFDDGFERVIQACAHQPRAGQPGTWIVPDMVKAYGALHKAGHAHSIETWLDGELAGGCGPAFEYDAIAHVESVPRFSQARLPKMPVMATLRPSPSINRCHRHYLLGNR